jgi:hypothetical protein
MRSSLIKHYLRESKAPLEQLALYIHLDQPFLFPDPKKVLKELQIETTTEAEEKEKFRKSQNRSIDSYAADEAVRGIG